MDAEPEFDKRTGRPYDEAAASLRHAQDHAAGCPSEVDSWGICIDWMLSDLVEAGQVEICGVRETGELVFRMAERFRDGTS